MSVVSLLSNLAEKQIHLWLEGDNLKYDAPAGAMTPEVINELKAHKSAIIEFLQQAGKSEIIQFPVKLSGEEFPASFAQQRLWFLYKLQPQSSAYNIHAAINIDGELQIDALEKACRTIIQNHDILRTTYRQNGANVFQRITNNLEFSLPKIKIDATALTDAVSNELHKTFNLEDGPIFRLALFETRENSYTFSFTIHHIAADAWSLGLFVTELVSIYNALISNETPGISRNPIQYTNYSVWQTDEQQSSRYQKQLAYWETKLTGVPNLDLPYSSAPHANTPDDSEFIETTLNQKSTQKFKEYCKRLETTPFVVILGAYAALLYRYTFQSDFCIGTPTAGRIDSQLEPLIGCFVNTLALRFEIDTNETMTSLVEQAKTTFSEATQNQEIPFEQVVNAVTSQRDLAVTPIFQTLLSMQNAPLEEDVNIGGLEFSPFEDISPSAQMDLKLTARESGDKMTFRFEFKKALFEKRIIANMSSHFIIILETLLDNPEQALDRIQINQDADIMDLLYLNPGQFNHTQDKSFSPKLIHELFESQVEKNPEQIAVKDDVSSLTYRELNQKANQLARQLQAIDQAPNSPVGVCLYRSINMSIALLGILKAGCHYVPFDPDLPEERLRFMAEDTGISQLITDHIAHDKASQVSGCCLIMEGIDYSLFDSDNVDLAETPKLFNIIYTSGSTGKPKGVMVPHTGIHNRLEWMQEKYPLLQNDIVFQKTPFSFDVSVWELFWPLLVGASIYYAKPDGHKDPHYLKQSIVSESITTMHFVPSMLSIFLETPELNECKSLKKVFCSGEALLSEQVERFMQSLPQSSLHNLYGPTEASIDVSYFDCQKQGNPSIIPIGKPIKNTQLHILDRHLQPVPEGVASELYIGGTGLAEGYLNRDELNAVTFVENPYSNNGHPSERLYKTGDLVRFDGENLIFLGRTDHQIKIRGNRLELGEIESRMQQVVGLREAIVVAKEFKGDTRLVAYYLASSILESNVIKKTLAESLPQYMIPSIYVHLEEWPLSVNGKINRHRLPEPDWSMLRDTPFVAPETDVEKTLAKIWSEVLGLEKIGTRDNFFDIGGHSLTAIQALTRAQEELSIDVPLREIFENPTIESIAALIEKAMLSDAVFSGEDNSDDEDMESFVL